MTLPAALTLASSRGLREHFLASYRESRPWWAFWVSEEQAVEEALWDCDLIGIDEDTAA